MGSKGERKGERHDSHHESFWLYYCLDYKRNFKTSWVNVYYTVNGLRISGGLLLLTY